jgi:hypothetical protein
MSEEYEYGKSYEDKSMKEMLAMLIDSQDGRKTKPKQKEHKKFRMPFSAKVNKSKLKKGYVTVEHIGENKSVEFTRAPIIDGTIKVDDVIHAVDDLDIFFYKGKPFVHQPKGKVNPWNPLVVAGNETYGQKYIVARLKSDLIKANVKKLSGFLIFGVIIAGIVAYYFLSRNGAA